MEVSTGTDIIEIERIKESIETIGEKFKKRVFTEKEITYCESKNVQKYQHYAARFAAKEATFKAISKYINDKYKVTWQDIEITNNEQGRPKVEILNDKIKQEVNLKQIDISLSHNKTNAIATVITLK